MRWKQPHAVELVQRIREPHCLQRTSLGTLIATSTVQAEIVLLQDSLHACPDPTT